VYQIYRIRRLDGRVVENRGRIVGLDRLGNEVEHSFTDLEIYYKPQTQYAMRDIPRVNSFRHRQYSAVSDCSNS
jgi:hypothetical protein